MNLLFYETGEVQNMPLLDFWTVNVRRFLAVVKLNFRQDGRCLSRSNYRFLRNNAGNLVHSLLSQADVLELERPTTPQ